MSGGAYDYFYFKLDQFADEVHRQAQPDEVGEMRRQFAQLLGLCATAAKAIEWVDSDDWGPGAEVEALRAVFAFKPVNPTTPTQEGEQA